MKPTARLLALALLLVASGCDREENAPQQKAATEEDARASGGLSTQEMENQVQIMTPEEAAKLGIIDTTEAPPPSPSGPAAELPARPATPGALDSIQS